MKRTCAIVVKDHSLLEIWWLNREEVSVSVQDTSGVMLAIVVYPSTCSKKEENEHPAFERNLSL